MSDNADLDQLLSLTTNIVSSHVANNAVQVSELPLLIQSVYTALATASSTNATLQPIHLQPAVPIRRSITPNFLICLEDGKKLKILKRHLKSRYNMTPKEYRERWGLPPDYPMVAPNYAIQRSKLAKQIGLGTKRRHRR